MNWNGLWAASAEDTTGATLPPRTIASLARIKMRDDELTQMVPELNQILDWVEQLGEVNVEGVEPMSAVIPNTLRLRNLSGLPAKVTSGVPKKFRVRRVIGYLVTFLRPLVTFWSWRVVMLPPSISDSPIKTGE